MPGGVLKFGAEGVDDGLRGGVGDGYVGHELVVGASEVAQGDIFLDRDGVVVVSELLKCDFHVHLDDLVLVELFTRLEMVDAFVLLLQFLHKLLNFFVVLLDAALGRREEMSGGRRSR
jgi:hypothetical protein